jgi:Ca2+-binding RTX toxin-like protein
MTMADVPGTPGDDILSGTADPDTITGLEGNDVLGGLDGDDALNGGPGNDVHVGGRGNDTIVGDTENDIIIWNNGDGSDTMDGGPDTDTQEVNGAPAAGDEFQVDAVAGSAVFQRVNLGPFSLTMNNVETLDVRGLGGDDIFTVNQLVDTDLSLVIFRGGTGNDLLNGEATHTSIIAFGEDGNDTLGGGTGNDWINGGAGTDTIIYHGGIDTVQVEWGDVIKLPGWGSVTPRFGEGFLILDFGGDNILALQWQPFAFTGQDYYATYVDHPLT